MEKMYVAVVISALRAKMSKGTILFDLLIHQCLFKTVTDNNTDVVTKVLQQNSDVRLTYHSKN